MSHVGGAAVSMLIGQPLPLVGVSVPSTYVLRLEVFQLTVNIVSIPHTVNLWVQPPGVMFSLCISNGGLCVLLTYANL